MSRKSKGFDDPPATGNLSTPSLTAFNCRDSLDEKSQVLSDRFNQFLEKMPIEKSEFARLATTSDGAVSFKRRSVRRQYYATLTMNLLAYSYGASCGWTSASVPLLMSDETPLYSGPITLDDASWIAAGMMVGGFAGNLLIGWVNYVQRLCENFCDISVAALDANRAEARTVHHSFATTVRLALHLLCEDFVLSDNGASAEWLRRRRIVRYHSLVHLGNC